MTKQLLDNTSLLKRFNLPKDALEKSGLNRADLERIYEKHSSNIPSLEPTANYIGDRLRQIDEVHSLKIRIKNPEHLIAKIIRKKLENPSLEITPDNYVHHITDLIGIRAMHLFKEDWIHIHDFIVSSWKLKEKPIANIRKGDPEELIRQFKDSGCRIKEHPRGYRSIHYLVKSQPSKDLFVAEVQVRTIFEEGWAEIDHRFSYPHDLSNLILAQFSVIFNRLAGSADEMGSYIRFLKGQLEAKEQEYEQVLSKHDKVVADLKAEIQKLEITKQQKEELERRLKSLTDVPTLKPLTLNLGDVKLPSLVETFKLPSLLEGIKWSPLTFDVKPILPPEALKITSLGNSPQTSKKPEKAKDQHQTGGENVNKSEDKPQSKKKDK